MFCIDLVVFAKVQNLKLTQIKWKSSMLKLVEFSQESLFDAGEGTGQEKR